MEGMTRRITCTMRRRPSTCYLLMALMTLVGHGGRGPVADSQASPHVDGSPILFNLNSDANEKSPLDVTSLEYYDMYNKLVERSSYWASQVRAADPGDTSDKKVVWKEKQGVVSWATNTDFTPPEVPVKYTHAGAPHIVFVLVDDWGWNDVGYRSTHLAWTTPTIDRLASEGVKLENYFTAYSCIPARGALLTGRYPIRLGLWAAGEGAELPLTEVTLAQEMKSAGYRTYMVGKWHLGFSTAQHTPANRGFDWSYTYWNGAIDYWTKQYGFYNDLHFGDELVTDPAELSSELHNGYLMETKAEVAIAEHATNYPDQPMFLYYAMQLIHGVWSAPETYKARCGQPAIADPNSQDVTYNYCALNVMLDEAVANLTCALEAHGMGDNTVLVLVSDNGGEASVKGNSYPFLGNKGSYYRGGMSGTGFVHSKLLPESARGMSYFGQMHVTDWLPTLMGLATGGQWSGALFGAELDGVDQWSALTSLGQSPRSEIVHYHDGVATSSVQIDMWKLNLGDSMRGASSPLYVFEADLDPDARKTTCSKPSLISPVTSAAEAVMSLISRPLQRLRDPSHLMDGRKRGTDVLDDTNIVALIAIVVTAVVLMSIRMAKLLLHGDSAAAAAATATDAAGGDCESQALLIKRAAADQPRATPHETSQLLVK